MIAYSRILQIAWPIVLANLAVPLLGLADTAVIGHAGTVAGLGAIAVGALIFNFLYWGFGFLRMGTTGLTAQALGAGDEDELRAVLARAALVALAVGGALVILQWPVGELAFALLNASADVEGLAATYYGIRVWGAPATLFVYAALGWFIGLQSTRQVLLLQVFLNGVNIGLDVFFALGLGWGVAGIAAGTVIAEWLTALLALGLIHRQLRGRTAQGAAGRWAWPAILEPAALRRTLRVNADIIVRTGLLILAFAWFTDQGAQFGDTILAANHVLLQFLTLSAFFLDGFAFAAESLVGSAKGAGDRQGFHEAARRSTHFALGCSALLTVGFLVAGPMLIAGLTDVDAVRSSAGQFLVFAALHPILAVWCFQLDGIFIGAMATAAMRNAMIASFVLFLGFWAIATPVLGNTGLWLAFLGFFIARGLTLGVYYPRLLKQIDPQPTTP